LSQSMERLMKFLLQPAPREPSSNLARSKITNVYKALTPSGPV
jgi:hypothetical protein